MGRLNERRFDGIISPESLTVLKHSVSEMKNHGEKASLVLLTFNRWQWTQTTINSVFKNTFFPHDLIVVDNHSTDGTVEKLKQLHHQEKIDTLILLPANYGLYAGFNIGLKHSHYNSWLSVLPNDVTVSPYWLTALCYVASKLNGVVATPFSAKVRKWAAGRKIATIAGMKVIGTSWATNPPAMTKATHQKIGYFRKDIDKGPLSFYCIGDTEYSERARRLGVGTYYVLDLDCSLIGSIQEERAKYPQYRQWKEDIAKVKRPKWDKGLYPRHARYETQFSKSWISQFIFQGE